MSTTSPGANTDLAIHFSARQMVQFSRPDTLQHLQENTTPAAYTLPAQIYPLAQFSCSVSPQVPPQDNPASAML